MNKSLSLIIALAFFLMTSLSGQVARTILTGVYINEVAGSGSTVIANDWIELHNTNAIPINLDSVFLSDSKTKSFKFRFKNLTIPAKGFIVVEADDALTVSTDTKAAFGISANGETVYLNQVFNGKFKQIDSLNVPASIFNTTYGRKADGSDNLLTFSTPTPSQSNNAAKKLIDVVFSQARGLYATGFKLTLTAPSGTTIRYTTNSETPSASVGIVYTQPIAITGNMVIKAYAYSAISESKVVTNTYIINSDPAYKEVPIVVISTTGDTKSQVEGACSFEYINKLGESKSTFVDAGFRVFGNASATLLLKKNYRVYFRSKYGYKKLNHSIFDKKSEENYNPVTEFNSLDLKSGFDATGILGFGSTLLSDYIAHGYMRQMGNVNVHVRYVHVFLNGKYNGVYALREHFSESYMASYFGGDKDKYDNIDGTETISKWVNTPIINEGTDVQVNALKTVATTNFQEIKKRVNVKHFIDFMMLYFVGDFEWEYRASADQGYNQSKWLFHNNDLDGFIRFQGLSITRYNAKLNATAAKGPLDLFTLAGFGGSNLEYKTMVKDRTLVLFDENSTNGVLSVNNMRNKTNEVRTEFRRFNSPEYKRWLLNTSFKFEAEVNSYINGLPTRIQNVKSFLNQNGLMHTLRPLIMNKLAGKIAATDQVIITNPNAGTRVYYTLDGQDVVFDNAVATWAKSYTTGQALPLKEGNNILKARAYANGNFGPLTEITYIVEPVATLALVGSKIEIFAQKQGSKAIVSWTSNYKGDDDIFEIEKLNDQTGAFEVIRTYRGSASQAGYFQYTDEDPSVLADNLYRIALYRNGAKTPQYSAVVRLDFSYMLNYSVYPNPANDFVNIEIHKTQIDNATLRIVNIYGQTVLEQVVSTKNGIVNLSTETLGAGQYILFMEIKGKRSVAKKLNIVR